MVFRSLKLATKQLMGGFERAQRPPRGRESFVSREVRMRADYRDPTRVVMTSVHMFRMVIL